MTYPKTLLILITCVLFFVGCTQGEDRILDSGEPTGALQIEAIPDAISALGQNQASACLRRAFRGITPTAVDGSLLGEPDPRDWGCVRTRGPARQEPVLNGTQEAGPPPVDPLTSPCMNPAAPNPTEGVTRLEFSVHESTRVKIVIYGQSMGQGPRRVFAVRTLVDGMLVRGFHTVAWDLKDDAGVRVTPGIYRAILTIQGNQLCGDIEVVDILQ